MSTSSAPVMTAAGGQVYHPRLARNMLIILAGMALMVTYVETMVLPAYGSFETFFEGPPVSTVVWITSAYLLVGVVATPVFGKLGDIYGKKKMLMVAMSIYAVAVSIAGFTPNIGGAFGVSTPNQIYLLIGARAFQGIGMGMFPLAFAMIPEFFPANRVGQAQGVVSAMFAGGAVIGLVGGGWIAQDYGWQLTYHTVIPVAILLVVLAYYILRESPTLTGESFDLPGISSLGIGLTMLMLGITESSYWGWTSFTSGSIGPIAWGVPEFMILAVVFLLFFGVWETRSRNPVVRLKSLKIPNILISNITGVIAGLTMFITFVTLVLLVEYPVAPGYNQLPFYMGLIAAPSAAAMLATGPFLGRLTSKYGPKPIMLLGFALSAVGALLLTQFNNPAFQIGTVSTGSPMGTSVPLLLILAPAIVLVGNVGVLIAMTNVIVLTVKPNELGVQTGMNQTFRNLGSAIGPVLVSSIVAAYTVAAVGAPGVQLYTVTGFQYCFAVLGGIAVVGLIASIFLRNYRFSADGLRVDPTGRSATTTTAYPRAIFPETEKP